MQAARLQSSRNRDTEGRRREEVLRWTAKGSRAGRGARQEGGGEGKEAEAFAHFKSSTLPPSASATTAIATTPIPTARQFWPPCDNLGAYFHMKILSQYCVQEISNKPHNNVQQKYIYLTYKPENLCIPINC